MRTFSECEAPGYESQEGISGGVFGFFRRGCRAGEGGSEGHGQHEVREGFGGCIKPRPEGVGAALQCAGEDAFEGAAAAGEGGGEAFIVAREGGEVGQYAGFVAAEGEGAPHGFEQTAQAEKAWCRIGDGFCGEHRLDEELGAAGEGCVDEGVLGGEVVGDGTLGEPRGYGDVLQGGALGALLSEERDGGVDDGGAGGFAALVLGASGRRVHGRIDSIIAVRA